MSEKEKKVKQPQKKEKQKEGQSAQLRRRPRQRHKLTQEERRAKGQLVLAKQTTSSLSASNLQPSITVKVPLDVENLYGVCVAYVSAALGRGWLSRADSPEYPYASAVYMLQVLISMVKGITPAASQYPRWLLCFGQALAPKIVRSQQGYVSYSFAPTNSNAVFVPPPATNIGASAYGYQHLMYKTGSGSVDMFPEAVPPAGYLDTTGADAWGALIAFMRVEGDPMTELIPYSTTTWSRNVSAFAMPQNQEGFGFQGSGGLMFQSGLEVPIHTPLLSVFASFLSNGSINPARYGMFTNLGSGDSLWASNMFFQLRHKLENLHTKKPTRFHPVDFLRFGDVAAQWTKGLVDTALKDSGFSATIGTVPITDIQCPLTLQEFLLVLRNEIQSMFVSTQVGAQAIYPRGVVNGNDNEFVPFIMSSNTVPLVTTGMRLPLLLCENVKSLVGRWVEARGIQPSFYCPILGKYAQDSLDAGDYSFVYQGTTYPVFRTEPQLLAKKKTKGGDVWEGVSEAPIDLIDGSSGNSYYFINDSTRLQSLTGLWNKWVDRFSTYSMSLTTLSKDFGVNVVVSVGMTEHWVPKTNSMLQRESEVKDVRLTAAKEMSTTVYSGRVAIAASSHDKILDPVFNSVTKVWVLPCNKALAGLANNQQTVFQRMQIMMGETFSVTYSAEEGGTELSQKNATYASMMVRGPTAPKSEIEEFFLEQSKKGAGGILSGLAAGFLGKAFGPTVGSIANTVAEALPI